MEMTKKFTLRQSVLGRSISHYSGDTSHCLYILKQADQQQTNRNKKTNELTNKRTTQTE